MPTTATPNLRNRKWMKIVDYFTDGRIVRERYRNLLERLKNLEAENHALRSTINQEEVATQSLLNAIPDTILVIDSEGIYLDFLCGNEQVLVKPFHELQGKNVSDFLPLHLAERCLKVIKQVIENNEIQTFQYELVIWQHVKYFEARVTPVYNSKVLFIIRDISEQMLKNKEINDIESWFRTIFNVSRDGMAVEMDEKIIYVNDAFVKLYGYDSPSELIGQNISIIQSAETDAMMREFGERRLKGEPVPGVYEAKGKCKDGSEIDIEVTATVFEQNGTKYIIDVNRNISERKTFERKLKEQNEELQKINKELDRFVYSASHDLRSPLRSLLGLIHILKLDNDPVKKEKYLEHMEKSVHNLDKFIQDIINYSRNSRLELQLETVHLYALINQILEDIKFENPVTIPVYANYDTTLTIITDRNRLSIILSNLLSNAFRYYNPQQAQPYIRINAIYTDEHIKIGIEDNGIGISDDHVDKIFDMFYRAHDKKVGSGLGLYIVKETVNMLKGEIYVESALGKGTTFWITLPK